MEAMVIAVGAFGWGLAVWSFYHLRKWAKQIRGARIAIAYKKKVKIDAPLVEWLLWSREAGKDKNSTGRMMYALGGTSVIIAQRKNPKLPWKTKLKEALSK